MSLNKVLLSLILYIRSLKSEVVCRNALYVDAGLITPPNDWFTEVYEKYRKLPDEIFEQAGIAHCRDNFEKMLTFCVEEGMMEAQETELDKFKVSFLPSRKSSPSVDSTVFMEHGFQTHGPWINNCVEDSFN